MVFIKFKKLLQLRELHEYKLATHKEIAWSCEEYFLEAESVNEIMKQVISLVLKGSIDVAV